MDINLSANSLFHFTERRADLASILKNGLYVRYSLENYQGLIEEKEEQEVNLPMVCFCDIPLSQVKRHITTYGSYAIGLTKKWGIINKINPVIYTYYNSSIANILDEISDSADSFITIEEVVGTNERERQKSPEELELKKERANFTEDNFKILYPKVLQITENLSHFARYIKPYSGKLYRKDKYIGNVRFYDEREWRYVPPKHILDKVNVKDSRKAEFYKNPVKRRYMNMKIAGQIKLEFTANDIRYIIVEKDEEIPNMLNEVESIFGKTTSFNDLKLLGTRLLSMEQIMGDL